MSCLVILKLKAENAIRCSFWVIWGSPLGLETSDFISSWWRATNMISPDYHSKAFPYSKIWITLSLVFSTLNTRVECGGLRSFLDMILLLWFWWQNVTNLMAYNNSTMFSRSSTGQEPKISIPGPNAQCWWGHTTSMGFREEFLPVSSSSPVAANRPCFVATSRRFSRLASSNLSPLHFHILLLLSVSVKSFSASFLWYMWYHLGSHLDNSEWIAHLRIFSLITSTKNPFHYKEIFTGSRDWDLMFLGDRYIADYSNHLWILVSLQSQRWGLRSQKRMWFTVLLYVSLFTWATRLGLYLQL